ncbi:hypothetical protein [Dokdonella fugitiva]|jgi:hypothetical protein|uniref:Lipoprotein n=1 Tax=Dokdonella fugitiva TaxID=328517 RepID=A0A4V2S1H0_9GAMM|nr:hypothetical protein [Dokdonella fugitiva]TCO36550.1 hypothetical protein EV148_11234 [Dokdonella fugitiva]
MKTILKTALGLTLLAALAGCVYEPGYVRHDGYRGSVYYSSRYTYRPDVYYYDYDYWPGYYRYSYPTIGLGVHYDRVHHRRGHDHRRDHHRR